MTQQYVSTRGKQQPVNFYQAIVRGIGNDGGLPVPDFAFTKMNIEALAKLSYIDLATEILSTFAPKESKDLLHKACQAAYGTGLFPEETVPVKKLENVYVAELFHGQTAAFKDMALALLPHLMTLSLKQLQENRKVLILTATSGDTGKAALEGFKNVEGIRIKVFYPLDGVSEVQKHQMVTQTGNNVEVIGIEGNFDDAQNAVKQALCSFELQTLCDRHNIFLSSANSINIGRLLPQTVYYFYSYLTLVKQGEITAGEPVNFCIPSGNFGNALSGYFAKQMGLPVSKFICASNKNNILTDFFHTGKYDANREFYKTNAPAMDILISSNLERLLYFMCGKDGNKVEMYMRKLHDEKMYELEPDMFQAIAKEFKAEMLNEEEVLKTISDCYLKNQYLPDTHTAIGYGVFEKYRQQTKDTTKTILLATASPYKFPESVYQAISGKTLDVYQAIEALHSTTGVPVPQPLQNMKERQVIHTKVINKESIVAYVKQKIEEAKI